MTNRKLAILVAIATSLFAAVAELFYGLGWVASVVLLAVAGHYSSMAGWLPALLNARWQRFAEFGLLALSTLWFGTSLVLLGGPNQLIWVAVSAVLFVANITIVSAKPKS